MRAWQPPSVAGHCALPDGEPAAPDLREAPDPWRPTRRNPAGQAGCESAPAAYPVAWPAVWVPDNGWVRSARHPR